MKSTDSLPVSFIPSFNAFTNNLEGVIFDYKYYAGACRAQHIGTVGFRKPYNVESYLAEVSV